MTTFKHTALVCRSEDNADRFYRDLLGLEKTAPWALPSALAETIFGTKAELTIINYMGNGMHFEIFVADGHRADNDGIEHTCIELESRQNFLGACRRLGVPVNRVPKGDRELVFVRDLDGNLFEIKFRAD